MVSFVMPFKDEKLIHVEIIEEANYKKGDAAKLLGLPSQQTLDNWCKKHGV